MGAYNKVTTFTDHLGKQRKRIETIFTGKSMTKTNFAKKANINDIVRRSTKTGEFKTGFGDSTAVPMFRDFSNGTDYFEACCKVAAINSQFESLDARTRARFKNSPSECLNFLAGIVPSNYSEENAAKCKEAYELGLVSKEWINQYNKARGENNPPPAPAEAPPAPPTEAPSPPIG